MKRLLILSFVLVSFIACKRQNMARTANARNLGKGDPTARPYSSFNPETQAAVAEADDTTVVAAQQETPQIVYRYLVSFYSVASGPDNEGMRGFEEWLATYGNERKMTIAYDKIPWGREGETEICFILSGMDAEQQKSFITAANEKLKTVKQVNTYENQPCKHVKRP